MQFLILLFVSFLTSDCSMHCTVDGEGNQLFSPLLMAKSLGVLWRAAGIDPPKGTFNQINNLIDQSTRDRPNDQSNISEVSEVVLHADCYTRDLTGNNFNHSDQFFIDSSLQVLRSDLWLLLCSDRILYYVHKLIIIMQCIFVDRFSSGSKWLKWSA